MKVICILQNAWGDCQLPMIFKPNDNNKSAKTIRTKVLQPHDVMHFCNTTNTVTPTAKGKPKIDIEHMTELVKRLTPYDMIVVCGKQAAEAVSNQFVWWHIKGTKKPIVFMPHPAARTLSNQHLQEIKIAVDANRKIFKLK